MTIIEHGYGYARRLLLLLVLMIKFSCLLMLAESKKKKKYTSIGGQAVIEGVMMRSPHSFVIALRLVNNKIRLRRDQWFGLGNKFKYFKKPFLRGILAVIESMVNGIVSLNYSANVAMQEELEREQEGQQQKTNTTQTQATPQQSTEQQSMDQQSTEKKAKEKAEAKEKLSEKIGWATFFTMIVSLIFGVGLFIFLPHWLTILLGFSKVESFEFHLVDGVVKGLIFILYVVLIGLLPDIKKIFQYHGAEHKAIATFEAGEDLIVENTRKFSTLHPRCGTSFIFFLIFISIIFFSAFFAGLPIASGLPFWSRHVVIVFLKIFLMLPVAGLAYEVIKFAGAHPHNGWCKLISAPGLLLQRITTNAPNDNQLDVALASLKTALLLEEKYDLKGAGKKVLSVEEVEIDNSKIIESSNLKLHDFLD
ncbi:MAG: DUF1385 domain-containing protein [Oligoflexia bacterium]|nr:DUF1385 domain-containing protein [Oligoflexia bacterium]